VEMLPHRGLSVVLAIRSASVFKHLTTEQSTGEAVIVGDDRPSSCRDCRLYRRWNSARADVSDTTDGGVIRRRQQVMNSRHCCCLWTLRNGACSSRRAALLYGAMTDGGGKWLCARRKGYCRKVRSLAILSSYDKSS